MEIKGETPEENQKKAIEYANKILEELAKKQQKEKDKRSNENEIIEQI